MKNKKTVAVSVLLAVCALSAFGQLRKAVPASPPRVVCVVGLDGAPARISKDSSGIIDPDSITFISKDKRIIQTGCGATIMLSEYDIYGAYSVSVGDKICLIRDTNCILLFHVGQKKTFEVKEVR